jgi:protein-tyrosine kinase
MSKLFEALTRGRETLPDLTLEPLLEGQTFNTHPATYSSLAAEAVVVSHPPPRTDTASRPAVLADPDPLFGVRSVPLRVVANSPILPFDGTHWRAGEQYRLLRTRIVQHPRVPRMLVVTSAGSSDGKTVTVINIAGALALKSDARVLLLDGDFRRSTICTKLGLPTTPGLANVLNGDCQLNEAIIQAEQVPNLYILPAGTARVNPAEMLDSSLWASVCDTCRATFEYIIVDSPPQGVVADYDLLQAACDGVIVVVRPDHTDRKMGLKTLQSIPKEKLLGLVVNCVEGWLLDRDRNRYGAYYYTGTSGTEALG